jgi:ATP-dependent DNA helicase HFM1/MER3
MPLQTSSTDKRLATTKSRDAKGAREPVSKVFQNVEILFFQKLTKSQKSKGQLKYKAVKHNLHDDGADMEMIDLANESPPLSCYDLSASDLNEKPVRLPKQKPKFSYASGQQPSLPYLKNPGLVKDSLNFENQSQEESFPSPSILFNIDDDTDYLFEDAAKDTVVIPVDFSESPEATIPGLNAPIEPITPVPDITSSFENGIFDFSSFNEHPGEQAVYSSPLMVTAVKRPRAAASELPQIKCRRVTIEEVPTRDGIKPLQETEPIGMKDLKQQQRSTPAWVDEFDQALIDDLKGIVDFVD